MDDTFSLSNISPQVGEGFNREYWARFEKFVRDVTKKADDVYVMTGPLFLPRPDADGKWWMHHPMIGHPPALVSVPTHFFKVVLAELKAREDGGKPEVAVGAFVMANQATDPGLPLEAFVVPLEQLEAAAGMKFFPAAISEEHRKAVDKTALAFQHQGRQALQAASHQLLLPHAMDLPANGAAALVAAAPGIPMTRPGLGAKHLCEHVACRMIPDKVWKSMHEAKDSNKTPPRA
jgi:DNA/RNA non-specific endonuclease